jgi:hypothetical protein
LSLGIEFVAFHWRHSTDRLLRSVKNLLMSVYSPSLTGEAGDEGPDGLEPPHVALEPAATPTTARSGDGIALKDAGTASLPSNTPSQAITGGNGASSGLHQPSSAPFPTSLVPVFIHRMEDTNLRDRYEFQFDLSLSVDENAMRMAEALYGPPPACCSRHGGCGGVEPSSGPSTRPSLLDADNLHGPHCNCAAADISGVSCGLECLSDSGDCVRCGHPVIYRICEAGAPPEPCDDTIKRSLKPNTQFLVTSFGEIDLTDDLGGKCCCCLRCVAPPVTLLASCLQVIVHSLRRHAWLRWSR